MRDPKTVPQPGTPEALQGGCTCEFRDGEGQDNETWPDWLIRECPLHDPNVGDRSS